MVTALVTGFFLVLLMVFALSGVALPFLDLSELEDLDEEEIKQVNFNLQK